MPTCSPCTERGEECVYSAPTKKRGPRRGDRAPASIFPLPRHNLSHPTSVPSLDDGSFELASVGSVSTQHLSIRGYSSASPPWFTSAPFCVTQTEPSRPSSSGFAQVWINLQSTLSSTWKSGDLAEHFENCIDVYMRHLFPLTPLVDERASRLVASSIRPAPAVSNVDYGGRAMIPLDDGGDPTLANLTRLAAVGELPIDRLYAERSLTLLTSLVATSASLLPATMVSSDLKASADCLLQASRQMVHTFEDLDIERPCASSVIIRYFHSLCVHARGQPRVSWYILGEAIRVAQDLRIHNEASLTALPAQEAHLRRSLFWQLSTGDRSVGILNDLPFSFSALNFG